MTKTEFSDSLIRGVTKNLMSYIYNDPKLKKIRKELRLNQTDAERLIWSKLRNKQLMGLKFYRQYSIKNYIVDFYCPDRRLAIEIDGGQHNENNVRIKDEFRSRELKGLGVIVLRFWNNDVIESIDSIIEEILHTLNSS